LEIAESGFRKRVKEGRLIWSRNIHQYPPIDGLNQHAYTESAMTATVKSKTLLTVPDVVRRRAGFKPGDQVEFKVSRGSVTILPRGRAAPDHDDSLTTEEAKKVRHAMKQAREGKVTAWSKVKHELGL
jgi:bifunctional DNA-binding transcriptional regulator/antitoxin component of YhaV-PrlF toxin-antitoxin module